MLKTHPDVSVCSTRVGMYLFHPSAFPFSVILYLPAVHSLNAAHLPAYPLISHSFLPQNLFSP